MTKPKTNDGRWNPKRQLPKIRIYNPETKTYYIWRRSGTGKGGSIQGRYIAHNGGNVT